MTKKTFYMKKKNGNYCYFDEDTFKALIENFNYIKTMTSDATDIKGTYKLHREFYESEFNEGAYIAFECYTSKEGN